MINTSVPFLVPFLVWNPTCLAFSMEIASTTECLSIV